MDRDKSNSGSDNNNNDTKEICVRQRFQFGMSELEFVYRFFELFFIWFLLLGQEVNNIFRVHSSYS